MAKTKTSFEKLKDIINAWETLAPNEVFAGRTLAQFQTETFDCFKSRTDMEKLETQLEAAKNRKQDSDKAARKLALKVVSGVIAHPNFGDNSDLYAEMGYVREEERESGLHRGKQPKTPAV